MPLDAILGAQWGDEGKGRLSVVLSRDADMCARFQGGPNAGHTTYLLGRPIELRMLPAGIVSAQLGVIGNGVVVDPATLLAEVEQLTEWDRNVLSRIRISRSAHVITADAIKLDNQMRAKELGTTGRGVGPTYAAKVERRGYRIHDLLEPVIVKRLPLLDREVAIRFSDILGEACVDTSVMMRAALVGGARIVAEGAQGASLDLDHGDYPYVTASNTTIGSVLTGLGVSHENLREVWLAATAYLTKLGAGPFPTQVSGAVAEHLVQRGNEYDEDRHEVRRCGWLDLAQLRRAARINGATGIVLSKLDVLSGLEYVELHDCDSSSIERFQGWSDDLTGTSHVDDLPVAAAAYLLAVAEGTQTPILGFCVGPRPEDLVRCSTKEKLH